MERKEIYENLNSWIYCNCGSWFFSCLFAVNKSKKHMENLYEGKEW
nr:MAG TPA: hypothetical protein [Caudoviricetes sp.]